MLKVVLFLLVGIALVAGAWALASLPGHVSATIGPLVINTTAPMAILGLIVIFVALLIVIWVLGGIISLPKTGAGWKRRRQLRLGEAAVTRVLVALAANEPRAARQEARRAQRLLGNSPQTLLLVAEAGRLSGHEEEAATAFRTLTKQPEARFLGYQGLLRQAVERRDWPNAQVLAREAEQSHPGTVWLRQQRADLAIQTGNWAEAADLSVAETSRAALSVAAAEAETDPDRALRFARQAIKADPAFTPAILALARRLRALGRESRAAAAVQDGWNRAPQPDLATFALARETNPAERHQLAKRLVAKNPSNLESHLLLARTAFDAGLTAEARQSVEAARAAGCNQRRLWLLLAEIEEQERGDTEEGRKAQRDALRAATAADDDPAWHCTSCGSDLPAWSAKCPSCDAIGTLHWQDAPKAYAVPVVVA